MSLLVQFLLRLTFGLAVGMLITSPRKVTSGYFRNHLYVTLGLSALAVLLSRTAAPAAFVPALIAAIVSYVGSVAWLYEARRVGQAALLAVALSGALGLYAAAEGAGPAASSIEPGGSAAAVSASTADAVPPATSGGTWRVAASITSGLLLGTTMAAMLLGHWYLNTPTMELAPLRRLIVAMGLATMVQAGVAAVGLASEIYYAAQPVTTSWLLFVTLRWAFGLVGVAVLAVMAWQTLKIPNTQSATGILYVAVIGSFVGETMSLLLSAESAFPL